MAAPETRGARMNRMTRDRLAQFAVPLLFAGLCLFGIIVAQITPSFLLREILSRFARNGVLVLSLLLPILAGLGLNFGMVVGAMAGQIAAVMVIYWGIGGISLFGGRGSIMGMLFGALIVGVFNLGLRIVGTDPQWTYMLIGFLIIGAVAIDQWIRKVSA
jgi:ribose/xylose/arabinose/galactoside ABC-type transport system permease subunit